MNRVMTIFKKELIDNLRDRRSLTSTLMYTLIGPGMILLMIVVLGNVFQDETQKIIELPVEGGEHAPALVQFIEQQGTVILPAPEEPQDAVRNGDVEIVLVIPEGYGEDFSAGKPATVQMIVDTSRTSAVATVRRIEELLEAYSAQMGSLRLLARGVSPALVQTLSIEEVDVSTPQSQAFIFLNMLPYFLVMTVFLGGAAVIIDATAGERERNSLEPLLINPVKRWELVVGKLLASLPFAVFTVMFSLAAFAAIFNLFPVEKYIGQQMSVDVGALGMIFLICLPMIFLASAIQMIIATFARTYKEAQTYTNWLPLIPALPGVALAFLPVKPELWTMLIPTFGQQILINQYLRGEVVFGINVLISTVVTLVLAAVLIGVAIQLYQREQVLFGKQ